MGKSILKINESAATMEELKECSPSAAIPYLQEALRERGYLFFRRFFSPSLIEKERQIVLGLLHSEGWGRLEKGRCIAIEPVHRMHTFRFYQGVRQLMEIESLHELAHSFPLSELMSRLLEEKTFCHPRKMIRLTYPDHLNPKDTVPPHQDLFHVKGERDTLIAWIPLGNYSPEEGGLLVAPKTHKQGLFPVECSGEGRSRAIETHLGRIRWSHAYYRMGDLLILHALTLHRSAKNRSAPFRLSLDCRFSRALGFINEEQLLPPYYPNVPAWHILCRNWKNPRLILSPSTVNVQSKDTPLDIVLNTPSRFAD